MNFEPQTYQASATVGVCMAGLAVGNAVTILHGGAGCDIKLHTLLNQHNLTGDVHRRVVCTKISEHDLVLDPGEVLLDSVQDIVERNKAHLAVITAASFVEVAGIDWDHILTHLRKKIRIPLVYVQAPDFSGDLFRGYAAAVDALAGYFTGEARQKNPPAGRVNILGYVLDRPGYEHVGNLHEMWRCLAALSLHPNLALLDGGPARRLFTINDAELNIALPGGVKAAETLKDASGTAYLPTGLPMGIEGTKAWIRQIADHTSQGPRGEELIAREEGKVRMMIRQAGEPLVGRRVALFADRAKLEGLLNLCADLKLAPVLAGVLDGTESDDLDTRDWDIEIMPRPGRKTVRNWLKHAAAGREIDLVIGTAAEVNAARQYSLPALEFGFPCIGFQALYPTPYMGFGGTAVMTSRIREAIVGQLRGR